MAFLEPHHTSRSEGLIDGSGEDELGIKLSVRICAFGIFTFYTTWDSERRREMSESAAVENSFPVFPED